jgi:hypothetical protein
MKPGRSIFAAAMMLILGGNERVVDVVSGTRTPTDLCEKHCGNKDCFTTRQYSAVAVRGTVDVYLQATQSIVKSDVAGSGLRAATVRNYGTNEVPGYPNPDIDEIDRQEQFKTTNRVWLAGTIAGGQLTLRQAKPSPVSARLGPTKFLGLHIGGKNLVNTQLTKTATGYEHCILGAIARPFALANLGRRIVIGSRVQFDVRITGSDSAIITPRVTYSRFPTTFIWLDDKFTLQHADPFYPVLEHCAKWSDQ